MPGDGPPAHVVKDNAVEKPNVATDSAAALRTEANALPRSTEKAGTSALPELTIINGTKASDSVEKPVGAASAGAAPKIEVVTGDITRVPADTLIAPINSEGMWFGGIDGAIQRAGGGQFHKQASDVLNSKGLTDGDTVYAKQTGANKGDFGSVTFVVDDLKQPLSEVVKKGLQAADAAGSTSATIPAMRTGVLSGVVEKSQSEVAAQIQKGINEFYESGPKNLKDIKIVVYDNKDFTTQMESAIKANPVTVAAPEGKVKVAPSEVNAPRVAPERKTDLTQLSAESSETVPGRDVVAPRSGDELMKYFLGETGKNSISGMSAKFRTMTSDEIPEFVKAYAKLYPDAAVDNFKAALEYNLVPDARRADWQKAIDSLNNIPTPESVKVAAPETTLPAADNVPVTVVKAPIVDTVQGAVEAPKTVAETSAGGLDLMPRADVARTAGEFKTGETPATTSAWNRMFMRAVDNPAALETIREQFSDPSDRDAFEQMVDKVQGMSPEERSRFEETLNDSPSRALDGTNGADANEALRTGAPEVVEGGGLSTGAKIGIAVAALAIISAAIVYAKSVKSAEAAAEAKTRSRVPFFSPTN